jgi:hypothetical protein
MTKLPQLDPRIPQIERNIFSVCHDSAALLNNTLTDGTKSSAGLGVREFSNMEATIVGGKTDTLLHLEKETYLNNSSGGKEEKAPEACLVARCGCCSGRDAVHRMESRKCRSLAEELIAGQRVGLYRYSER